MADLLVFVDDVLSPQAQSQAIADVAQQTLREAETQNAQALGHRTEHKTFVDGRPNAPLESVRPDGGVIVFEFQLVDDTLAWIADQLVTHSPRRSGAFAASHILLADGKEADPKNPPPAAEYVFLSPLPYARPLERGHSRQAPNGVYEVVAAMARRRFGNQASVEFTYRPAPGGSAARVAAFGKRTAYLRPGLRRRRNANRQFEKDIRQPAIVVVPR
jgi:hypothetical protein